MSVSIGAGNTEINGTESIGSIPQVTQSTWEHNRHVTKYLQYSILDIRDVVYDNIGEGNGNQLQYSCLENPMDGGAW